MEEGILKSTKKVLSVNPDDPSFDLDIITHINATFSIIDQLGVNTNDGGPFAIDDSDEWVWENVGLPPSELQLVRTYMFLKVKMLFDPPTTGFQLDAAQKQIQEYEFRLNVMAENRKAAEQAALEAST